MRACVCVVCGLWRCVAKRRTRVRAHPILAIFAALLYNLRIFFSPGRRKRKRDRIIASRKSTTSFTPQVSTTSHSETRYTAGPGELPHIQLKCTMLVGALRWAAEWKPPRPERNAVRLARTREGRPPPALWPRGVGAAARPGPPVRRPAQRYGLRSEEAFALAQPPACSAPS